LKTPCSRTSKLSKIRSRRLHTNVHIRSLRQEVGRPTKRFVSLKKPKARKRVYILNSHIAALFTCRETVQIHSSHFVSLQHILTVTMCLFIFEPEEHGGIRGVWL
jgi:hypothetical protein